jgi:hypothetical protein
MASAHAAAKVTPTHAATNMAATAATKVAATTATTVACGKRIRRDETSSQHHGYDGDHYPTHRRFLHCGLHLIEFERLPIPSERALQTIAQYCRR